MDTDAYGGFITVDVEAISCLFRMGIIGGTEYADIADDVLSASPKYYRHALECTKRAVEYFRQCEVSVVAHLGDVLAAVNADAGTQWSALQSFNDARSKLPSAAWHVAPGACDARCFGPDGIGPAFGSGAQSGRSYYSFFPAARWRVLVLDANDATGGFSSASASDVPDGVLAGGSGSLGPAQCTWLNAQLSVASAEGERVLILSNRGVRGANALLNAQEVEKRIAAYPGTVAAVLSLGDGAGHYEKDGQGVHHISPFAVVGRDMNEDAFGCLEIYDDKLKLEMVGWAPDDRRQPDGWPNELPLPRGGALVAGGDSNAAFGFFMSFLFFMLNVINMPLQPVYRMLTSNEDDAPADEAEAVEAGDGMAPVYDEGASGAAAVAPDGGPMAAVPMGDPSFAPVGGGAAAGGAQPSASCESGAPAAGEPGVVV